MAVILCYGDSNTHGTPPKRHESDIDRYQAHERWPGVLQQQLGADHTVIEDALPGRTVCNDDPIKGPAWNGLTYLSASLAAHYPVDVLIVMLGTNDFQHRFAMTGQEVALGLARLADVAGQSGHARQVLFLVPPMIREEGLYAELFNGARTREATLKEHMIRFLTPKGVHVLDANSVAQADTQDGVHWRRDAHHALGTKVAETVTFLLAEDPLT